MVFQNPGLFGVIADEQDWVRSDGVHKIDNNPLHIFTKK